QPDETGQGDTKYCWCRVTKYGFPEREVNTTRWVAANNTTDNVSAGYCDGWCAYNCAQKAAVLASSTPRVNMATMCVPDFEQTINYVLNDENAVFPATAIKVPHSYISSDLPISLENAIPVRPYYTFDGWYDNANFEGTAITEILSGANQDITLYAKWSWTGCQDGSYLDSSTNTCETCPDSYTSNGKTATSENDCYIEWNCPEISTICPQNATCTYIDPDHLSGIDYYGDTALHCEIDATCNTGYESNNGLCTPIEYDIQYVIPDGDFLSTLNNDSIPRKYTVESIIDLSGIEATRPGYSFEGWYDNENLNGSASTTLSNLQPGGITLYAKFEPVVCTVVYHDGDAETQETYTAQATIDLTQPSAKVRYTFEGWCEDLDNCPEPKNTLTASNGTINLYAKWARIVCQDGEYLRYTECLSCPSGYPYSNGATATEASQCYRTSTCNNSPVCPGNATDCELAVNGEIVEYYGDAMPYCQETFSCKTGYTPQINLLSGANILTASNRVGFANRNGGGQNVSYQPLMPTFDTWFNTFTYGTVYGRALCSAKSGADYNNYQWNTENPGLTSTEAELTAAGEGQYCWCQINGFSPENTYTQNMSSPWMMEANLSNTNNCFSNCSKYCSYAISGTGTGLVNLANNRKYRAALYDSATLVQGTSSTSSAAGKTWSVTFPYGEVSGISLCSPYSGTHSSASNPVVFDAPVPEDSHQVQYCWCKATNVALNDNNSLEYMLTDVWNNPFGMSNCKSHCAETCAKSIKEDWSTRNQLFRVWAKKQACVPEQYAIMYHNVDMDDVVWSNDSLKPSVYTILDADVTIGRPSRTAYSFYGWCSSAEDANDPDSVCPDTVTINTGSSGTVNLYAKWGPKRYSITYMDNETPLNLLVPYSYIEAELPVDLPTTAYSSNDDFVFDGWYNNPGFLGDAFTKIDAGSRTNRTFYAKWRPKYYAITYKDGENQLDNIEPILTPSSNEETISLPSLEDRDGLTFIGWCD
ncbi:MAG: InlB B-repeat-containing protein, partial [Alphaproteobacteria bacterium]|nr:InlB B-repeat-containing protein [Alphaproteobacteria bacterium]